MNAKTPNRRIIENAQFDKDVNFVCPTCKRPLKGLHTYVSDSLIALDKNTTQNKVQRFSECTAKFHDKQLESFEE